MRTLSLFAFVLFLGAALLGSHALAPDANAQGAGGGTYPEFLIAEPAGDVNFIQTTPGPATNVPVWLKGDLDGDGNYETLFDSTTRASDGSWMLTVPNGAPLLLQVSIGASPDARPRQKCEEWGPGKWACWWE